MINSSSKIIIYIIIILSIIILSILPFLEEPTCLKYESFVQCHVDFWTYKLDYLQGNCYIKSYDIPTLANNTTDVTISIYVVDSIRSKDDMNSTFIEGMLKDVNSVWRNYGVNIRNYTEKYFTVDNNLIEVHQYNNYEFKRLADNVVTTNLYNRSHINVIFIPKFADKFFFILDYFGGGRSITTLEEGGSRVNLILIATDGNKNITWDLIHELSHTLGNEDIPYYSGRYNLMNHGGCIKEKYYPTILNKDQVARIMGELNNNFK